MEIQKCIPQRIGTRKCVLLRIKIKNCQCQETREGFQRRTRCLFRPLLSSLCGDPFRPSILFQIGWIGLIIPDFQKIIIDFWPQIEKKIDFLAKNRRKKRNFSKKIDFLHQKSILTPKSRKIASAASTSPRLNLFQFLVVYFFLYGAPFEMCLPYITYI